MVCSADNRQNSVLVFVSSSLSTKGDICDMSGPLPDRGASLSPAARSIWSLPSPAVLMLSPRVSVRGWIKVDPPLSWDAPSVEVISGWGWGGVDFKATDSHLRHPPLSGGPAVPGRRGGSGVLGDPPDRGPLKCPANIMRMRLQSPAHIPYGHLQKRPPGSR